MTKDYTKIYGSKPRGKTIRPRMPDTSDHSIAEDTSDHTETETIERHNNKPLNEPRVEVKVSLDRRTKMEKELRARLLKNEKVIWREYSNPYAFGEAGTGILTFAIFWSIFSCSALIMTIQNGQVLAAMFLSLFAAAGALLFYIALNSKNLNILTKDRAIIISSGLGIGFREFAMHRIKHRKKQKTKDGSGSLVFSYDNDKKNAATNGFLCISNVDMVANLIAQHQDSA